MKQIKEKENFEFKNISYEAIVMIIENFCEKKPNLEKYGPFKYSYFRSIGFQGAKHIKPNKIFQDASKEIQKLIEENIEVAIPLMISIEKGRTLHSSRAHELEKYPRRPYEKELGIYVDSDEEPILPPLHPELERAYSFYNRFFNNKGAQEIWALAVTILFLYKKENRNINFLGQDGTLLHFFCKHCLYASHQTAYVCGR